MNYLEKVSVHYNVGLGLSFEGEENIVEDVVTISRDNSADLFAYVFDKVYAYGRKVAPRGNPTKEVTSVLTARKPLQMVPFVYGRHPNYFGMLMESLWPLSPTLDNPRVLEVWNSKLRDFADNDIIMFGAYGPRIHAEGQLVQVIKKLKKDKDSRQAVITILRPSDQKAVTKDLPCNDMVMFKVRDGFLNMTVINRSNDMYWGLFGVNFPQFAMLQNYVATRVGVLMGIQTHLSDSLHIYTESKPHLEITERLLAHRGSTPNYASTALRTLDFYKYVREPITPYSLFETKDKWDSYDDRVGRLLEYIALTDPEDFEEHKSYFQGTPASATFVSLLEMYAQIKRSPNSRKARWEIFHSFDEYLFEDLGKNQIPDYFGQDWIFGCLYTLAESISLSRSQRKTNAIIALEKYDSIMNQYGHEIADGGYVQLMDFLAYG